MSHAISQALLFEYDHEMGNTRKTLERVPEALGSFAPHSKSRTLAQLTSHLVDIVNWSSHVLDSGGIDFNPPDGPRPEHYTFTTRADALARFDAAMKKTRARLANTSDEQMMEKWALKAGAHTVFSLPRAAAFRGFVMNHMIHHRAQLGVYLRLSEVPVPGLYGPSADEQ